MFRGKQAFTANLLTNKGCVSRINQLQLMDTNQMTLQELKAKFAELQVEAARIRAQGEILTGAKIDSSKPGGTSRGNPSTQYRLRIKGHKSRYLKANEVEETRAAITRGKQLQKLERELQRMQNEIVKKEALLYELIGKAS